MDLDFPSAVEEKYKKINDVKEMVLATCADNQVTSRLVSVACFDDTVYFLSWKHHTKCRQIAVNPLVSFSFDNLQMNGKALLKGDPKSSGNAEISEKYKSKQPMIFKLFSRLEGMIIVEVKLTCIKAWERTESGYYIEHFDIAKRTARRLRPEEEDV